MSELPSLNHLSLFKSVDDQTLQRLSLDAKVEMHDDGSVIFRQGDIVSAVVILLHGYVKLVRTASCGDETVVGIRSDGESLCDLPTSPEETCRVSAEAVGTTCILKLPSGRFIRALKESPTLACAVLQDAKNKVGVLIHELEALKAQCADQRLARFILSLCPAGEECCRFRLPYDKRLVAAQLGVTQETLSRAFAKLRELGVRTETREVSVDSVSRLAAQCDELGRQPRLPSERRRRPSEESCDAV